MNDLRIASLEGFACFQRDEDLDYEKAGGEMIPPYGAASKWHENPLAERVRELEAENERLRSIERHYARHREGCHYMKECTCGYAAARAALGAKSTPSG
jgi:hypothetical protein